VSARGSAPGLRELVGAVDGLFGALEDAAWELRGLAERAHATWSTLEADWRALVHDARALGREVARWPDQSTRAAGTAWLLAQLVSSYRLHAVWAAFLGEEEAREALDALHLRSARRVYQASVRRGGGLLKVGQLLSARPDLLPDAWVAELSRLQDMVPAVPFAAIRATVEEDLGASLESLFEGFEPEPVGSASIAQVHRAWTREGREVAVKVRRPGIERLLALDLDLLEAFLPSVRSLLPEADWETVCAEIRTGLCGEVDFAREAATADRLADFFSDHPAIRVPRPIPSLCAERVLTTDFFHGIRITDVLAGWSQAARAGDASAEERVARTLGLALEAYLRQVLEAGLFQADPHPGNLLVTDRGELVLLDFGCARALTPAARGRYLALVQAFLAGDGPRVSSLLHELGFATRSGRPATLLAFADALLGAFRRLAAAGGEGAWLGPDELAAQARALLRTAEEDPVVRIPEEFVLLARVFGTLGGLFQHHRPRLDFARHVAPVLASAGTKRTMPELSR
jgi:ubiquinone biosynthesis protein